METKKKVFIAIAIFYIAFLFFPLLSSYTPINAVIASIVTAGSLLIMYSGLIKNKIFGWYLVYVLILAFFVLIGKTITVGLGAMSETRKLLIEIGYTLPSIMIFLVLRNYDDIRLYKIIGYSALGANILSFLYFLPLVFDESNILRFYVTVGMDTYYSSIGLPTYAALHSYVIVIAALLFSVRENIGHKRIIHIAFFILYLYIIYKASITTNLIISIIVLVFAMIYKDNLKKSIVITLIFSLFVFSLHITGVIESLFDVAIEVTEGTYSNMKIIGFKDMYMGDNDDVVSERDNLHNISFMSFLYSPLWGGNVERTEDVKQADDITSKNSVIGGHSSILDRLGGMGLMGGLPFIMVLWLIFKDWKARMPRGNPRYFYIIGAISALILLYQKGIFGQEGWFSLCVYLPCLILANSKQNDGIQTIVLT